MTASRSPANSDLMALICLIGGAVRGAGEAHLLMQLMVIGTMVRPVGQALNAWLLVEELYSEREFYESSQADEDGWDGEDEFRPGRMERYGRVAVWRHVTRFGLAVLVPIQWGGMIRQPETPVAQLGLGRCSDVTFSIFFPVFAPGLASPRTHVLIVPVS